MKFYTFGIQRTCTNFAKELILRNFLSDYGNVNDYGHWSWKHNMNAQEATSNLLQTTPVIFCYKTPLMWMESIIRNDVDFINRWGLVKYPDYHDPDLLWENSLYKFSIPFAIEKWIEFHIEWMKYLSRTNFAIMDQKKMCDPQQALGVLNHIQDKLKLVKNITVWTIFTNNVDYRAKPSSMTGDNFEERKKDYLTSTTRKLSAKQIDYIQSKIPNEIIDFYEN